MKDKLKNFKGDVFIMKANFNKEALQTVGTYGVRIGKTVLIEGCKAVALNTAKTVIQTGFDEGFDNVKDLQWNDFLSDKEARAHKKAKKQEKVSYLKAELAKLKKSKKDVVVEADVVEVEETE